VLDRLRVEIPKFEFATDSPLEGDGFEPSVPLYILTVSDPGELVGWVAEDGSDRAGVLI
jgi:hypothetical protein